MSNKIIKTHIETDSNGVQWACDTNGNRCSTEYFGDITKATKALLSLKNCKNCKNCSDCDSCTYCSYCTYCMDCHYWNYCADREDTGISAIFAAIAATKKGEVA